MKQFSIGQVWRTGNNIGVVTSLGGGNKYSSDAERIAVINDGRFTHPQICKFGANYSVYGISLYSFEFENTNNYYVPELLKILSPIEYSEFVENVSSAPGVKLHIQPIIEVSHEN